MAGLEPKKNESKRISCERLWNGGNNEPNPCMLESPLKWFGWQ